MIMGIRKQSYRSGIHPVKKVSDQSLEVFIEIPGRYCSFMILQGILSLTLGNPLLSLFRAGLMRQGTMPPKMPFLSSWVHTWTLKTKGK